ncbi:hypothetical protein CA85_40330 [Allorhodopirellula solitaria]|uniref:Uncharacterized protein n=1 Tax=Allorhodopirellula solitaria TaxID=2527987 RepID=A0A5C5X2T5_9BACT|nr:hypothetical protein CA85_40330 [Allorhodopirellula solitaria]
MAERAGSNGWTIVVELAATSGVDPWPLTMRELIAAATAHCTEQWNHTAETMALLASMHSGNPCTRADFHPHMERPDKGESVNATDEYERIKRRERRRERRK